MSAQIPTATLNNGLQIPLIGMGCWTGNQATGKDMLPAFKESLQLGYTHFDTATLYCNEAEVGQAVRESGIPREKLFITTKVWWTDLADPLASLNGSLERAKLDYYDLLLVHWPQTNFNGSGNPDPIQERGYLKAWANFEKLLDTGKVKTIGVSNFSQPILKDLLANCKVVPAVNQIETHPFNPDYELLELCKQNNIHVTSYCPVGQAVDSPLLKHETINRIAGEIGATAAQVALSWGVQRGTSVIPKSSNSQRMRENLKLFKLSPEQMNAIDHISDDKRYQTRLNFGITSDKKVFGLSAQDLQFDVGFPSVGIFGVKQNPSDF